MFTYADIVGAVIYRALSMGFPGGSEVKASACDAGDPGSIPGLGRSPGEGCGNQIQYSCLENPMDGGAWWATVHGVAKSRTRLSAFTFTLILITNSQGRQSKPSQSHFKGRPSHREINIFMYKPRFPGPKAGGHPLTSHHQDLARVCGGRDLQSHIWSSKC